MHAVNVFLLNALLGYYYIVYKLSFLYAIFSTEVPSVTVVHMANIPPPNSQRPHSFHPDFDREVFSVIFSVGTIISSS
jgi:hypothetical protein